MSPTINLKALPLHRLLALAGAALLFASMFLPWTALSLSENWERLGASRDESVNGWDGAGYITGAAALVCLGWEVGRSVRNSAKTPAQLNAISASLSTLAALLGAASFFRALSERESTLGITFGPGSGAYLMLVSALLLFAGAAFYLRNLVAADSARGPAREVGPPPPPPPPHPGSAPNDAVRPDIGPAGPQDM